jgi:hypothetical protein
MPYGLFNYGGTIHTMGESPTVEWMNERGGGFPTNTGTNVNPVTLAIPEDGPIDYRTGQVIPESYVTWAMNEDGPNQQATTMMMGEEGPINPPSGGTGGCPAGYAPAQTGGGYPVAPNPYIDKPQIFPGQTYQFYGK